MGETPHGDPDPAERPAPAWAKLAMVGFPILLVLALMVLEAWLR